MVSAVGAKAFMEIPWLSSKVSFGRSDVVGYLHTPFSQ
jgi:hypothetical protein